jgi:WD40 repeat protein
MNVPRIAAGCGLLVLFPALALPQAAEEKTIDREPVLQVTAGGPTAFVTSLAFAAGGQALYAGGYDKVLHVWALGAQPQFAPSASPYRVPMGPGIDGAINAIAVSPDGAWLAVGGRGMLQHGGVAGFGKMGIWVPGTRGMSPVMWEDQGTIHVFDTRTGNVQALRGHRGPVLSLAFAPARAGKPPTLASYAREFDGKNYIGAVRLWDAAQGKEIAKNLDLPDPVTAKRVHWPRLAVWHTGEQPRQVRVALACEDGTLRLWDAAGNLVAKPDGEFNNTVAYLGDPDRVLTGSFSAGRGVLKLWNAAGQAPEAARQFNFPEGHKPRALGVFAAQAGGAADRAAVIAEAVRAGAPTEYLLYLLDANNLKSLRPPVKLWSGTLMMPALAVSPDGRFVAAAGNKEHEVYVFAIAELLKNQDAPQRLRGAGVTIQRSAFVRKGTEVGLLLSEVPRTGMGQAPAVPQKGDLIFSFAGRALRSDITGWQQDAPAAGGWEVQPSTVEDEDRPRTQLSVLFNKKLQGTIRLSPGVFLTEYALLPPVPPRVPLLAVAATDLNQSVLSIYDVATGEHIRQLTGHVSRVHSLAFAGDGRLLVSAADDQMVCVWTLTDVDQILGRKATLRGLVVVPRGGRLVLDEIDRGQLAEANRKALAAAQVKDGDVIEGFIDKGKLRPAATLAEFYDTIIVMRPGQSMTLRFKDKGDVPLTVGQGTDEHKPLFSLFVTRSQAGQRRWIGWNPVGPYDASDREAERLLGWHKNTGEDQQPATFALAQEHREANYRQDILKYLVRTGNVGQAIDAWRKDHPERAREPKMTLWINEPGVQPTTDNQGRVVVRVPPAKLFLSVHEPPLGKVETVRWQVDGKLRGEFTAEGGDYKEWSADLTRLALGRGEHRIRVTLRTAAPDAQDYPRELLVNYQPPRPVVKAIGMPARVVDKPEYRLQAEVTPGEGHVAEVRVVHRHDGKDLLPDKPTEAKTIARIDQTLKLEPGLNQLRVTARNKDAPADSSESDFLTVEVLYKTARPLVTLSAVQPLPAGPPLTLDPDRPDRPVVVDTPRVRLVGEIEAADKIAVATWASGERAAGEKRTPLAGEKTTRLAVAQEVTLAEPGKPFKVRFQAKTATSDEAERAVVLLYQPALPEVRITSPSPGQPFIEGQDLLPIRVEGRLVWPEGRHPCTAQLFVNDQPQGAPVNVTGKDTTLTIPTTLPGGESDLRIRLSNSWREEKTAPVVVRYRRPPRIVKLTAPKKSAKPFADVIAEVETAKTLPLTQLSVKGNVLPATAIKPARIEEKGDTTLLQMVLRELPLQRGTNRVEFQASNSDGWALKPASVEIELEEPPEPRAEVALLDPPQNLVVEADRYTVELRVRSRSPIRRIELDRGGQRIWERTDFSNVPKSADGWFEVRERQPVPLLAGPNSLKVVAQNAGGEQVSPSVVLTFRSVPVRVRIEGLLVQNAVAPPVEVLGDNTLRFQAITDRVQLQGQVEWGANSDTAMRKITHVRVAVNGFQQPAAVLAPPTGNARARTFRAEIQLTLAKRNHVSVRLAELPQEQGSRTHCLVDCADPNVRTPPTRQAHLLVVDTSKNLDEQQAVARVLRALQAAPAGPNRFQLPGFVESRLYTPLVGEDVTPEKVYGQLRIIKQVLRKRAEAGAVNDMVFLYFRGGETIDARGHFFRTSDSERDPELRWSGIPCEYLRRFFAENLGAQLVLLDVVREPAKAPGADQVALWPEDPYVAVVRYAWSGAVQAQTEEARLLGDWAEVAGQARKLGDVLRQLSGKFVRDPAVGWRSIKFAERLTYFAQVSPSLEEFPLARQ